MAQWLKQQHPKLKFPPGAGILFVSPYFIDVIHSPNLDNDVGWKFLKIRLYAQMSDASENTVDQGFSPWKQVTPKGGIQVFFCFFVFTSFSSYHCKIMYSGENLSR